MARSIVPPHTKHWQLLFNLIVRPFFSCILHFLLKQKKKKRRLNSSVNLAFTAISCIAKLIFTHSIWRHIDKKSYFEAHCLH
ncbi:hypothetical protein EDC94DRAFT_373876 [Helicostylum pulchrum]|nr:hypothetical protein EDC94DRAFT_373876 [Helicostylum pulchrum]